MGRRKKLSEEESSTPLVKDSLEKKLIMAAILFFVTIAVYIPAMNGGYIYDDDQLLYKNIAIRRGVGFFDSESWKGLWSLWYPTSAEVSSDYAPLSSTTYWIEWRFWGNNYWDDNVAEPSKDFSGGVGAPGYHTTNIILHAIAALLLWLLLTQLRIPGAWIAALVWAIHPVGVESVAWISERRNTLSMVLCFMTLLAWFKFQRTRGPGMYVLAIFLFLFTMLAKTSIVMLPFVLLLGDWWLRNRVTFRDLLESMPFFLISLILGCVTLYFQNYRAINKEMVYIGGYWERFTGACFAIGFYAYKAVVPINLSLIYPEWHKTLPKTWPGIFAELLIGAIFASFFIVAILRRNTWGRGAIFGLGYYALMIFPVLGFTKMAYLRLTLVSDHFQYAPMIGVIVLVVAWLTTMYKRMEPSIQPVFVSVCVGVIGMFGVLTWGRADAFHDRKLLWADTLKKNPASWQAHSHMGVIYYNMYSKDHKKEDIDNALLHWQQSATLAPYLYEVHNNYALALMAEGRMEEALAEYGKAVDVDPEVYPVQMNYADALMNAHRFPEAIEHYQAVLKMAPGSYIAYFKIGIASLQMRNFQQAIACFDQALAMAPNFPEATNARMQAVLLRQQELQKLEQPTPPPMLENIPIPQPPEAPKLAKPPVKTPGTSSKNK